MSDIGPELTLHPWLGAEIRTLPELLNTRARLTPASPGFWSKGATGGWKPTSWVEFRNAAHEVASELGALGLQPGERVGIMGTSTLRWDLAQFGILCAGGVVVGLDPLDADERLNDVVRDARLAGLIVGAHDDLFRIDRCLRATMRFTARVDVVGVSSLAVLSRSGGTEAPPDLEGRVVGPETAATLIFTSGTTGQPKSIVYSHRQACLAVASIVQGFPDLKPGTRLVCWLPLSNLFQRILNLCAIASGAETYYVESPKDILKEISGIKPHIFIAVPRFYEKLYAGLMEQIEQAPGWRRRLAHWGLRAGDARAVWRGVHAPAPVYVRLNHALADWLVLRRLREPLGPSIRWAMSGSAPMPPWLLERFNAIGLLVLEAYGLSENIIPIAANRPEAYRLGSVGQPMPGNTVRLGADGELQVRGPGVFTGYDGDDGSAAVFDQDGYLQTGDFAMIDADGFITLTGRKSEVFKTSTGRRIAPSGVESVLRQVPYVEHAMVLGAGRPFLVAVLSVADERLPTEDDQHPNTDYGAVCERLRADLSRVMTDLPEHQRPAGFVATKRPFTVVGGELTPNRKLRRRQIEDSFRESVDRLYSLLSESRGWVIQEHYGNPPVMICSR